ncbi:nucleotide exchange factor GrpE [Micavibrio aeruginosavorus]|uniref:nucleotide exchange factor GrpE n=1 Tax=Micavibrio aeruginosavorus TaxID=349221 RepID=UPI003F4AA93A
MNDQNNNNPNDPANIDPLAPTAAGEDNIAPDNGAPAADERAALEDEIARLKDHVLRALADGENTRKRAAKEREDATKYAVTGFARDLLSVADNLRRALDAVPEEMKNGGDELLKNLLTGIEATEREMLRAFEKNGIKKIEPINVPFDPHQHEVMFEAPMPGKPAGTIIQLIEAGYVLNDRLLRPARVGVSRAVDGGEGPDSGPGHIDKTA